MLSYRTCTSRVSIEICAPELLRQPVRQRPNTTRSWPQSGHDLEVPPNKIAQIQETTQEVQNTTEFRQQRKTPEVQDVYAAAGNPFQENCWPETAATPTSIPDIRESLESGPGKPSKGPKGVKEAPEGSLKVGIFDSCGKSLCRKSPILKNRSPSRTPSDPAPRNTVYCITLHHSSSHYIT